MPFRSVSSLVNEGPSLTIVNEGSSLTIVNETTNFIKKNDHFSKLTFKKKTIIFKNDRFVFDFSSSFS